MDAHFYAGEVDDPTPKTEVALASNGCTHMSLFGDTTPDTNNGDNRRWSDRTEPTTIPATAVTAVLIPDQKSSGVVNDVYW